MSRSDPKASEVIRFALADSVAFSNARDWDIVSSRSARHQFQ